MSRNRHAEPDMRLAHSSHDNVVIDGSAIATYIPAQTSAERISSLPCSPCVPPCRCSASVTSAPLSPRAEPYFFPPCKLSTPAAFSIAAGGFQRSVHLSEQRSRARDRRSAFLTHPCIRCMAPMTLPALLDGPEIIIFVLVDVTRFLSSSLGPRLRHRTELLSSSLELGPPANGVSSSLVHLPHFRFGLCPDLSGPIFGWGLFFFPLLAAAAARWPGGRCRQFAENAWQPCRGSVCAARQTGR